MSYILNDKLRFMEPYQPISGDYPIRLDANESFLPYPEELRQEIGQCLSALPFQRYPDPMATSVCQAFGRYYRVDPRYVTAGNGSDELISIIMTAFLQKGEKVLTFTHDFSMYRFYGELSENQVLVMEKDEDLTIPVDRVIAYANQQQVRLIIFSNPCNPTSLGMTRQEVVRLVSGVNALVVLDEAYMDFYDQSLLGEVQHYDNLMILRTCSKAVSSAALRLGFAVANETLTKAMRAAKSPYNVNSLTQAAGTVLFNHPDFLRDAARQILLSREALYTSMQAFFPHMPRTCANFVYCKTPKGKAIYEYLLSKGIAIRFMGQYLRITAGSPAENQALTKALEEFFRNEENA